VAEVIAGFTCANDVTARDHQKTDGVFARAKGFDSFCPLGPELVTGLNPEGLNVRCFVNGDLRQDGNTEDLSFDVPRIVAFVSSIMRLEVGDILLTGTPSGVSALRPGDEVTIEIECVGRLSNPVVSAK